VVLCVIGWNIYDLSVGECRDMTRKDILAAYLAAETSQVNSQRCACERRFLTTRSGMGLCKAVYHPSQVSRSLQGIDHLFLCSLWISGNPDTLASSEYCIQCE